MSRSRSGGGSSSMQLLIGIAMAVFAVISFLGSKQFNPITGQNQYISLTADQEISLGLQSEPRMIAEFGGLYQNKQVQDAIDQIGFRLVNNSIAQNTPWQFEFSVLNDNQTVNAFALPGGRVFITTALLSRLETNDEVAGVLAHEIVHVLARHGTQRIAKSDLTNGLLGAVSVATGDASAAQTAAMIGQLINLKYGRDDELQSDALGVCLMIQAGYNPEGMLKVQRLLASLGGARQPEYLSTHPNPENRIAKIQAAIANAAAECPK
ncbi:MAG: M48 family metalloprotease [Anaerolineales bacterium]|nr:M48 family metalloprotease [Anaerolineales bacterium]